MSFDIYDSVCDSYDVKAHWAKAISNFQQTYHLPQIICLPSMLFIDHVKSPVIQLIMGVRTPQLCFILALY